MAKPVKNTFSLWSIYFWAFKSPAQIIDLLKENICSVVMTQTYGFATLPQWEQMVEGRTKHTSQKCSTISFSSATLWPPDQHHAWLLEFLNSHTFLLFQLVTNLIITNHSTEWYKIWEVWCLPKMSSTYFAVSAASKSPLLRNCGWCWLTQLKQQTEMSIPFEENVHACSVIHSCPPLLQPMYYGLPGSSVRGIFSGKNTVMGCHFLLQGMFLTQVLSTFS